MRDVYFQFFRSITSDSAVLRDDYDVRDGNNANDFSYYLKFFEEDKQPVLLLVFFLQSSCF